MAYVLKRPAMGPAYSQTPTIDIFRTICKVVYLSCGCNFWFEDMEYPQILMKIYKTISKILEVIVVVFIISGMGSIYTQHNLTPKQNNNMYLFGFNNFLLYFVYVNAVYYKREIRELTLTLAVRLKEAYNDEEIEKMMIKAIVRNLTALVLVCCSSLFSYGLGYGVEALTSNATFTTVIPIWPDVEDRRAIAGVARLLNYSIWWLYVVRVLSIYLIVIAITIGLTYQFKNLCKYFVDLNDIFEGPGNQEDKERRYEEALKVGIKMHSLTLWCIKQTQLTSSVAFSAQVIINVSVLALLMMQMMFAERTLIAVMPIIFLGSSVLISTGVFLWNAGDVTIEASRLPTAIFHSGWHNCQKESSVRVRKLITVSIAQAQKRVFIKGLGFIEMSYESYATIVKTSYSVFSVIY